MAKLKSQLDRPSEHPDESKFNKLDKYENMIEQPQKPKDYDYLDFEENERRLKELTQPGKLDRFKSLLDNKDDIFPQVSNFGQGL